MSTSASSLAPTPETGAALEKSALVLASLSTVLLWLGSFAWAGRYESPLVLLPVSGTLLAPFAIWAALHAVTERRRLTTMTRSAIALSVLPTVLTVPLGLGVEQPVLGALMSALALGVFFLPVFLPVDRAWVHAPPFLGALALGVFPLAWWMESRPSLGRAFGGQLLALLAVQLGSRVLAHQGRASLGVICGFVFSVLSIVGPLSLLMVCVTIED